MQLNLFTRAMRFLTVLRLFLGIFWSFYSLKFKKIYHSNSWLSAKKEELYRSQARRFRLTAIEMGGLLIKLGQFFSTRVDVLPASSIEELSGLQDEVSPVAFQAIKGVIEEEFSSAAEEIFAWIDEMPLASASLGQVHQGKLKDNKIVAVKILRPGIESLIDIDLKALHSVIYLLKRFTDWERFVDFDAIYEEFSVTIQAELDYIKEGQNAEKIAQNTDDPEIVFPSIYWEYTSKRVLSMEYLEGIKITDYESLKKADIALKKIAQKLLNTYIDQILITGFYHADPHPGNLFVRPDGKIIMIDFGMVGTIPEKMRQTLLEMVFAMVKRDYYEVVEYLNELGFLRYNADKNTVSYAVKVFLEKVLGSGSDLSNTDILNFLDNLENLLYEQPFQLPANFTFLGRALGTLYGICLGLDPEINFLDQAKPYLDKIEKRNHNIQEFISDKAIALGTSFLEIPPLAAKVLQRIERGDIKVNVPVDGIKAAIEENTRAMSVLAWSLSFGFSLATSSYLLVNQYKDISIGGFILSAFLLLLMMRSNRAGPKRRRAPHPPVLVKRGK